ncbi:RHOMBOID-like protein 10, chloroplastic [Eucalyptus grandis]|uniref:RHOMBOID-like protein 10, chloroplastic n=1 Tax=Eucalyptus grandis TaxID=71139 RepID=UPI0008A0F471|nr:RHOMBOID-like protein 10, chloroplastic [Eucalyptus grandis]
MLDNLQLGGNCSWGAQMNHLINKGQWWRLATSNFLYANVAHLVLNCCCLDALGPNVEALSGPERFPMVYATSAIASSATSYWLTKAPSIGASSKFRIVHSVLG